MYVHINTHFSFMHMYTIQCWTVFKNGTKSAAAGDLWVRELAPPTPTQHTLAKIAQF